MAGRLPPPPRSLLNDRELYIWLSKIHAILNGQDSSYEMSGDMLSGGMSQQALALAGTAGQSAESARLLSPPLPQVTRGMIQDAQLMALPSHRPNNTETWQRHFMTMGA